MRQPAVGPLLLTGVYLKLLIISPVVTPVSGCPDDRVRRCFWRAFSAMKAQQDSSRRQTATCQSYEHFLLCFNFRDCPAQRAAQLAASQYSRLNWKQTTAETVLGLRKHINRRCSYECSEVSYARIVHTVAGVSTIASVKNAHVENPTV